MINSIYICDACKIEYTPKYPTPIKRGTTIKQVQVCVNEIYHPKNENLNYHLSYPYESRLNLCLRCEHLVATICSVS